MLTTSERMAQKLAEAIAGAKLRQSDVAQACGVTKQAVQGWLKTGRIDKKHLATLAQLTNHPLTWWFDTSDPTHAPNGVEQASQPPRVLATERSTSSSASNPTIQSAIRTLVVAFANQDEGIRQAAAVIASEAIRRPKDAEYLINKLAILSEVSDEKRALA